MKKSSISSPNLATFPTPATFPSPASPSFLENNMGINKGWSSERVPMRVNRSKRQISFSAFMPSSSGRTLPSKWEDAERWITSPFSSRYNNGGLCISSDNQTQRRAKSKSGPLGHYLSAMQGVEGGLIVRRHSMVPLTVSPFSSGPMVAKSQFGHLDGELSLKGENQHSASLSECSDFLSQSSLPSSEDEKLEPYRDGGTMVSRVASRRDMATQMSPEGSNHSSSKGWSSSYMFPPSVREDCCSEHSYNFKSDVRYVQVDKWASVFRWSKRLTKKDPPRVEYLDKNASENGAFSWDIAEAVKKFKRDEAKVAAWENLQKAKAEAAIRKLEMKLEKKRASSMEKILKKLQRAETQAQEMRRSMADRQALARQVPNPTSYSVVSSSKPGYVGSFSWCFESHAI